MAGWGSGSWGTSPWGGPIVLPPPGAPLNVRCRDLRHVIVEFDDTAPDTALEPERYSFLARSIPSHNPTVASARFLNGRGLPLNSMVELTLENCLSPGVVYDIYFPDV